MNKVKKVFKYGTGEIIPDGAVYLSTQVEKFITKEKHITIQGVETPNWNITEKNRLVWHYFLVEAEE